MEERILIVDLIITVGIAIFAAYVVPKLKDFIEKKKGNEEFDLVMKIAKVAVTSVQKEYSGEDGAAKKEKAINYLITELKTWGINDFTKEELEHYVETAYQAMKMENLISTVILQ